MRQHGGDNPGLGSELISDTRKGLKEQEVEDSTRRDMEEDDDHQACEALRLKRLSCKKIGRLTKITDRHPWRDHWHFG